MPLRYLYDNDMPYASLVLQILAMYRCHGDTSIHILAAFE